MKNILFYFTILLSLQIYSQDNCELIKSKKLKDYVKSKYSLNPIEGTEYITIDKCKFLLGIGITSSTSKNLSVMNRVSSVKARRQVLQLFSGTKITTETIIREKEITTNNSSSYVSSYLDVIKENASGFVNGMETLLAFKSTDGSNYVYIITQKLK